MLEFIAYRVCGYRSPFWEAPNPAPGRFNRANEAPTTYLGLHPLTPWAEVLRALSRREPGEIREYRPVTWAARVLLEPEQLIELTFDNATGYGLEADDLVSDDHGACQAFAAGLRASEGAPVAVVAPSAALPGTCTLVLLSTRVAAPYDLVHNFDPQVDTSVSPTAVLGNSPLRLAADVHYRESGVVHPGLAAWQEGEDYEFTEPTIVSEEYASAPSGG